MRTNSQKLFRRQQAKTSGGNYAAVVLNDVDNTNNMDDTSIRYQYTGLGLVLKQSDFSVAGIIRACRTYADK